MNRFGDLPRQIAMPFLTPDQEPKLRRLVLEVLFAAALVVAGIVALLIVAVVVAVYAAGGSIGIVPGAHAPHR